MEAHGRGHIEDADGDGDLDLVLHFRTRETGIQCGDTAVSLMGETFDGQLITGTDAINTVGCLGPGQSGNLKVSVPTSYALLQNYPNPFNPETEIRFQLPKASNVELTIFNTLGQEIRSLVNAYYEEGYYSKRFDATGLSSGLYLYRIQAVSLSGERFVQTKKLLLLR